MKSLHRNFVLGALLLINASLGAYNLSTIKSMLKTNGDLLFGAGIVDVPNLVLKRVNNETQMFWQTMLASVGGVVQESGSSKFADIYNKLMSVNDELINTLKLTFGSIIIPACKLPSCKVNVPQNLVLTQEALDKGKLKNYKSYLSEYKSKLQSKLSELKQLQSQLKSDISVKQVAKDAKVLLIDFAGILERVLNRAIQNYTSLIAYAG